MSIASSLSYVYGQCTAFVAGALDWVQPGWGNAATWPSRASAMGYPIGHTPHIGDIAAWAPGQAGASSAGHVAVVTGISSNNITVQEENWTGGPGFIDTRTISSDVASKLTYIRPKGSDPSAPSGLGGFLGGLIPFGTAGASGINLNPADAIGNAINTFTGTVQKGAVDLSLYMGFFLVALVLIFMALMFMVFSTNTGRTAVKGAALAAV